ncbi:hypothetical protein K3495_g15221 [Podosphaera aphanis]|nr:hypothetical protein K3495_g15221 [Podosphaera aphanis]
MNTQVTLQGQTRASYLSRDQRLEILALYRMGFAYKQITTQLRETYSQVKNTVQSGRATPRLRTGRNPKLSPNQIDQLEEFISSSREARQCSYLELSIHFSSWAAGESAIRSALKGRGFSRCLPRRSPPLSENHMMARKVWAEQRLQRQEQEWSQVLWSDETWINDGPIMPSYVTRKVSNSYINPKVFLITQSLRRKERLVIIRVSLIDTVGIIFGCFGVSSPESRGPCVFWEADWGKMTSEGYRQHILPLVVDWHRNRRQETGRAYLFMHDNTPVHKAPPARDYLMAYGTQPISWPAYSPDLNSIENVWGMMKLYIQNAYPEFKLGRQRSKAETRRIILEAWYNCTTEDKLRSLILSISKES